MLFKATEDKVKYVEVLVSLITLDEKITDSNKIFIYNILSNYQLPEEYAERIWKKICPKREYTEIILPIINEDYNVREHLIKELVLVFTASGKYQKQKTMLVDLCNKLNINTKLEIIKNQVLEYLKQNKKN